MIPVPSLIAPTIDLVDTSFARSLRPHAAHRSGAEAKGAAGLGANPRVHFPAAAQFHRGNEGDGRDAQVRAKVAKAPVPEKAALGTHSRLLPLLRRSAVWAWESLEPFWILTTSLTAMWRMSISCW